MAGSIAYSAEAKGVDVGFEVTGDLAPWIAIALVAIVSVVALPLTIRLRRRTRNRGRSSARRRLRRRRFWIVTIFTLIGLAAILAIVFVPARLMTYWADLTQYPSVAAPTLLAPASQVVLWTLGGLIALITLGVTYDRHAADIEKEAGATERDFRARFTKISEALNSSEWARRSNGLRELGILADDWYLFGRADERRRCIDVLCEYLQSPWSMEDEVGERESFVREVGFRVIAQHLRTGSPHPNWQSIRINLRNANIQRADFSGIHLEKDTRLDLSGSSISDGYLQFENAEIRGLLYLDGVTVHNSEIGLWNVTVRGALHIRGKFTDSRIKARHVDVGGRHYPALEIRDSEFNKSSIDLEKMDLSGRVHLSKLWLNDSSIDAPQMRLDDRFTSRGEFKVDDLTLVNSSMLVSSGDDPSGNLRPFDEAQIDAPRMFFVDIGATRVRGSFQWPTFDGVEAKPKKIYLRPDHIFEAKNVSVAPNSKVNLSNVHVRGQAPNYSETEIPIGLDLTRADNANTLDADA